MKNVIWSFVRVGFAQSVRMIGGGGKAGRAAHILLGMLLIFALSSVSPDIPPGSAPVTPLAAGTRDETSRPADPSSSSEKDQGCLDHAGSAPTAAKPPQPGKGGGKKSPPAGPEQIAFASDRSGDWEIYTMNTDGSGLRLVISSPGIDREPDWSPDGRQLAFVKIAKLSDWIGDIYIVNADGSGLRKLIAGGQPSWSPDGRRIAYNSNQFDSNNLSLVGSLRVINVDGTEDRPIKNDLGDATWMPDGKTLFAGGISSGNPFTNVYKVTLADDPTRFASAQQLTRGTAFDCSPAAAPDGSAVAFVDLGAPNSFHIAIMRPDGSGQALLTQRPAWDSFPSWSPDRKRIVFARDPDSDPHWTVLPVGGPHASSLWMMNADGTGLRQLTSNAFSDADPVFRPGA